LVQTAKSNWVLQTWLDNLVLRFYPPCLDLRADLRIRGVLKEERKEMYGGEIKGFDRSIDSVSCVIETQLASEKDPWDRGAFFDQRLEQESVLEALLIYRDRLTKRQRENLRPGQFKQVDVHTEFDKSVSPMWQHFVSLHHRFELEFQSEDRGPFKALWEKLNRSQKKAPYLEIGLGRLSLASQKAGEPGEVLYRLVDYVSSTEALLTVDEPEVSFKLPARMATLLGRSPKESQDVYDFMRQAYKLRSKLVHGEAPKKLLPFKVRQTEVDFEEVLGRLHSYSRECIRFVIELVEADFEDKEELLRFLDLACVRSDLRQSMTAFLDSQQGVEKLKEDFKSAQEGTFHKTLHDERHGELH